MAVKIGVQVQLEGSDRTGEAFKSAAKNAEMMVSNIQSIKSSWQSTVTAISTSVLALKAVFLPIVNLFAKPIKEAMEADKAMSRLEKTLKATNQTMGDSVEQIDKYISAVEVLTLSDEKMISSVLASNLAYGMNVKQAKLAIEASTALSKITGTDLWSANQLLLQSMNLQLRGIAKIVPEVNKLSEAQLRSGQAIMVVIEKLGYLNEMTSTTPYLAFERSKIIFEDLQRSLGRAILSGVDWNKTFETVKSLMDRLGNAIENNKDKIALFGVKMVEFGIASLEKFVIVAETLIPQLGKMITLFQKMGDAVAIIVVPFVQLALGVVGLNAALTGNKETYNKMNEMMIMFDKMLKGSIDDLLMITETVDSFNTATAKIDDNTLTKIKNEYVTNSKDIVKAKEEQINSEKTFTEDLKGIYGTQLSAAKTQFSNIKSEQLKTIDDNKRFFDKLKVMYKDILDYVVNWAPNMADAIKRAFTPPKVGEVVPKSPNAPAIGKGKESAVEGYKKLSELGTQKKGGIFSDKEFTQDKRLADQQRLVLDNIAALEKSNVSSIETAKIKSLNAIKKLEEDAIKYKVMNSKVEESLASARSEVFYQYSKKVLDYEIQIANAIGDVTKQRTLTQKKEIMDLLEMQRERGAKDVDQEEINLKEISDLRDKHNKENIEYERKLREDILDLQKANYEKIEIEHSKTLDKLGKITEEKAGRIGGILDYEAAVKGYQKISEEHNKAVEVINKDRIDADRKAAAPLLKTINSTISGEEIDKWNEAARNGTAWMNAAKGGLEQIINQIGAMWGPIGEFIAGIINILIMSKDQFNQLVDGLIEAIIRVVPAVIENIPSLIEKIALALPDIIEAIIGTLFSVPVWVRFITRIFQAVGDLFQGIFLKAVTGKSLKKQVEAEAAAKIPRPTMEKATFGADIADQGENRFKIKDIAGKMKAGTLADIQENLPTVTEEASKNFVDYLIEGWKDFWDMMDKAWKRLWGNIVDLWEAPFKTLEMWWKKLIKMFQQAWDDLNPFKNVDVEAMGVDLQKVFGPVLTKIWHSILTELVAFAKNPMKALRGIADSFLQFMRDPFNFLNGIVNKIGNFMTDTFPVLGNIANQFKDFAADPLTALTDIGDKLSKFILDKMPFLKPIADAFTSFREATHNVLVNIVEGFKNFIDDKFPALSGLVQGLLDFVKDPMQTLKDVATSLRDNILSGADKLGTKITEAATSFWDKVFSVADKFGLKIQEAANYFKKQGAEIIDSIKSLISNIGERFKEAADNLSSIGSKIWEGFKSSATNNFEWLKNIGWKIWDGLADAVKSNFNWLKNPGWKFWDGLVDALKSNFEWLKNIGWKFWDGLVDALKSNFDWIKNIGWKFWDGLADAFKANFDWFAELGKKIFEGFKSAFSISVGGGGGGGTLGQIGRAIGFSSGGVVPYGASDKATVALFSAMGALRAENGIDRVPGAGISDIVPILARPGERVLTPQQAQNQSAGSVVLNISINVSAGAKTPDKAELKEMGDRIIEYIKRESKNGRNILRPSGVY